MPWWPDLLFAMKGPLLAALRHRRDVMDAQQRDDLRTKLRNLHFSGQTIDRVRTGGEPVNDYAAIKLRDTEKLVHDALQTLKNLVGDPGISIKLERLAHEVTVTKVDVRERIRQAILQGGDAGLAEEIERFNSVLEELDTGLLGART